MKILVYGAGAIGMAFGGFLSRHHDVTLLGRARHLDVIRKKGLRVSGIWGRHVFRRFTLAEHFKKLSRADYDLVLVTVKSRDTLRAARDLRQIVTPRTVVLSLQNGLGNVETLHRYIPPRQVLAAPVIIGVVIRDRASVRVTVMGSPLNIGRTARPGLSAKLKQVVEVLDRSGIPAVAADRVTSLLWAKVVYNSALNPLASLIGCHYGWLAGHDLTRLLMDEVIEEIYAVAKKARIRMNPATSGEYRRLFYGKLVPRTRDHHPSMLQDLQAGRRTEIQALNGAVVKLARRYRVPVPVNRFLTRAILEREKP